VLVSGPTSLAAPSGVQTVAVRSTEEMARAVQEHAARATVVVMAAAVSDYRPAEVAAQKVKKTDGPVSLSLVRTTDILRSLGQAKGDRLLVGFAAETEKVLENARGKLRSKNLDLIVANDVTREDGGFAAETNVATLIDARGGEEELPGMSKRELAERILDQVVALRKKSPRGAGAPGQGQDGGRTLSTRPRHRKAQASPGRKAVSGRALTRRAR
jgi:phosphopantothenoylcysteine decarboxylase/phosphopantothenate--cysteine ligase